MTIKCITFDLDDTLWDGAPVIARAEQTFYAWLQEDYPRIAARYSPDELTEHRMAVFAEYPELHHDFTQLRKLWLAGLARESDCEDDLVETGFRVFWHARNDVKLFDQALDALEALSRIYRMGAITNGNADVNHIGIGHYFDFVVSAASAGAAKPHPDIFHAALREAGVSARDAVHVGDDPERDVMGASSVGMSTIWVNPRMDPWPSPEGRQPDAVIRTVAELHAVLGSWTRP